MSTNRWDPFRDMMTLREAMSNLLEDSFVAPRSIGNMMSGAGNLALDVHENANDYVITAALPGVNPDDVDINVLGNVVRIHGEFKTQEPRAGESQQSQTQADSQEQPGQQGRQGRWLLRERRYGAFDRVVTLPAAVKAEDGQAQFENGVLTLTLPKVEEAKPRAIKINAHPAITGTASETQSTDSPQS